MCLLVEIPFAGIMKLVLTYLVILVNASPELRVQRLQANDGNGKAGGGDEATKRND